MTQFWLSIEPSTSPTHEQIRYVLCHLPGVYPEVKVQVMTDRQVDTQMVPLQFHHTQEHRNIARILEKKGDFNY